MNMNLAMIRLVDENKNLWLRNSGPKSEYQYLFAYEQELESVSGVTLDNLTSYVQNFANLFYDKIFSLREIVRMNKYNSIIIHSYLRQAGEVQLVDLHNNHIKLVTYFKVLSFPDDKSLHDFVLKELLT